MYLAKDKDKSEQNKREVKKTAERHYEDTILPFIESLTDLEPRNPSKPIVTLMKSHKHNLMIDVNLSDK